jgi:2,4-dienoyl-CoA reductase-like NADH-dependent reductase (Old Yellow Enzyme family)
MGHLFSPLTIRGVTLPNRVAVSPMCQYSARDGIANDWHFVHLGSRAAGGAGLVMAEATAVLPEGRISPEDLGLWDDAQLAALARIAAFVRRQGAVPGVQLAHAGRKASTWRPWSGHGAVPADRGGWTPLGPDAHPFAPGYPVPRAMTVEDIDAVVAAFGKAAARALAAGFEVVEIHAAHGYLLHSFLSPLSNTRGDDYGGGFEQRACLLMRVVERVREAWPDRLPVFVRLSVTDWTAGGWDLEQSVELARRLARAGVDLIDCSSGGTVANATIPIGPGYQVPLAAEVRRQACLLTGAVGLITAAPQADQAIRSGQADLVFLARALLRDPYWPLHAAQELGHAVAWPAQYLRAAPAGTHARADAAPPED